MQWCENNGSQIEDYYFMGACCAKQASQLD
jgi:hypothetical protein